MHDRWRVVVVVILVFFVTTAAILASRRPRNDGATDAGAVVPGTRSEFTHAYVVGRKLTYAIEYRSEGLLDATLAQTAERASLAEQTTKNASVVSLSSEFVGALTLTVVERHDDGSARVLATLTDLEASIVLSDRVVPLDPATFDALGRGFFVDQDAAGDVRGIAVEADTPSVAQRLAAQIVAFLQLKAPAGHGARWETDEKDPLGDLHARYAVVTDAPNRDASPPEHALVEKSFTRRIAPRTSGALGRLIAAGGTAGNATLAYEVSPARGLIVEAAGALTTEQLIGDLQVGSDDSTIVIRLEHEESVDRATIAREADARTKAVAATQPLDPAALRVDDRRRENEALLARLDLPAVVADARAHPPPPQSRDAATYARILAAAVDVSAEGRAHLEGIMREPGVTERTFAPLARAFGENGSPEAQAALVRIIGARPKADPGREVALFSLGRADAPTDATMTFLETLGKSDDPHAFAALLALGRATGQLTATAPERGKPVLDRLLARVDAAPDDGSRVQALEAIANAGSPLTEIALARWANMSSPPNVRRAAISAHRLIPTTSARDVLVKAMRDDADASVRGAALEAVVLRSPDDVIADAIADRLAHDPAESVKKPAASLLMSACRRSERACAHIERLKIEGDDWTRHELSAFVRPRKR